MNFGQIFASALCTATQGHNRRLLLRVAASMDIVLDPGVEKSIEAVDLGIPYAPVYSTLELHVFSFVCASP